MESKSKPRVAAVLLAAGRGERFGADKLYQPLGDRPVLAHALLRLARSPLIGKLVVVIRPGDEPLFRREVWRHLPIGGEGEEKRVLLVHGGRERQDSARAGVEALAGEGPELVLIHDGARPFFSEGLLERLIEAAREHGAAVPALPVRETIRLADETGFAAGELDRGRLYRVQTPQCFRYGLLREALAMAHKQGRYFTDDAGAVATLLERKIKLVPGEEENIKITTPLDLELAELILRSHEGR